MSQTTLDAYRDLSLWWDSVADGASVRASLSSDLQVDVAIIGGGYTGLWTAYYLKKADPSLRVAILEKEICGFGASGRNGGWCSALFAGSRETSAKLHGRDAAIAQQRAMFATVDEVGRAAAAEGIECDFSKGGTLIYATQPAHAARLQEEVASERAWGFGDEDLRWLSREDAAGRIAIEGSLGATFTPHCARIHPGKLVRGLADVVERMGTSIYEHSEVTSIGDRSVRTAGGRSRPTWSFGPRRATRQPLRAIAALSYRSTR